MIASLPMYWFTETKAAHVAFWGLVRDHLQANGVKAPKALNEMKTPHEVWGASDLTLSQICHLPYRLEFRDKVTRIAASDYGLEGCGPGQYRSLFIVRDDHFAETPHDLDGATMALNSDDSHSGWGDAATWALARNMRFNPIAWTGSHRHSMGMVVTGEVDFCTIDARTFEILRLIEPTAQMVRIIGATDPSPGMTFVTAKGNDPAPYLAALKAAIADIEDRHRLMLGLKDVVVLQDAAYDLPLPPNPRDWQS